MAAASNWQSLFAEAAKEVNYGRRVKQLAALGQRLARQLPADAVEASVAALPRQDTFSALNALTVAQGANCWGFASRLLSHPSQAVRFKAVGRLCAADAERALMAEDSNQQLKAWIIRSCAALPCNADLLEHAYSTFQQDAVWLVLQRTDDQQLFDTWAVRLHGLWPTGGLPGLARLVNIFPDSILRLLDGQHFDLSECCWSKCWSWLQLLAQRRPVELLRQVCMQPRLKVHQGLKTRLFQWAWRHQHAAMVQLCWDLSRPDQSFDTTARGLVQIQQQINSSHARPTVRRKIDTVVTVFLGLPDERKTLQEARQYIELIERTEGIGADQLVDGYWRMVGELGRGKLEDAAKGGLFIAFASRLPAAVAVEQFFRVLRDIEPPTSLYHFVQSTICKSDDGKHDQLMLQVFEHFLQRRDGKESIGTMVSMFETLLQDAVSMDIVQRSFDILTARLGGASERSLLKVVIARMKALDELAAVAREQELPGGPPQPKLPLPTSWVRFIPHPQGAPHYVAFLHAALATWAKDPGTLEAVLSRFGTGIFWSTFEQVLLHALGQSTAPTVVWDKSQIDVASLAQVAVIVPVPPLVPRTEAAKAQAIAEAGQEKAPAGLYFKDLEKKKHETFGRDAEKREIAYARLIREAKENQDMPAAFDDLLPFLVTRLGGEQENLQFGVVNSVLPAFPAALWSSRLEQVRALWKVSSKARGTGAKAAWMEMGRDLVMHGLVGWKEDHWEPAESCILGVELAQSTICFSAVFGEFFSATGATARLRPLCDRAVQWLVEAAVPLPKVSDVLLVGEEAAQQPLQQFCALLQEMATAAAPQPGKGGAFERAERSLWQRWPHISQRWDALLGRGLSLVGAEYLLVGVVSHWLQRQASVAEPADKSGCRKLWWAPLKCKAYTAAVQKVLLQIEIGEIPSKVGANMIAKRSQVVQMIEEAANLHARLRHNWSKWSLGPWYSWRRATVRRTHPEDNLLKELAVLGKLVGRADVSRQVLWCAVHATEGLAGPVADGILEAVLGHLDARSEGMARCVVLQYPYLAAGLCDEEESYPAYSGDNPTKSPDLLTPALELWLDDVRTRDERVGRLMTREHPEHLLFFGNAFAEHLTRCRQEWLHQCLLKLEEPPRVGDEAAEAGEFYHHTHRVPSLSRVALLGKGWAGIAGVHDPNRTDTQCLQTYLWHPDTQALFLRKALTSTDMNTLAVIPSLEYVDGVGYAAGLLEQHPRAQEGAVSEGGWTVIQPSGSCHELWPEVERRFLEVGPPKAKNSLGDREADHLLIWLGRADHADAALKVLGKYASKFKRAKEALMQALPNLSPSSGRRVIQEVCFAPEAGVSLQVAALKLLMELKVPNALQLYRTAWRDGVCHRDVAAIILTKVATSPVTDWAPEEVQDMFQIFTVTDFLNRPTRSEGMAAEEKRTNASLLVPAGKKYPEGTYEAMSAVNKDNLPYIAMIVLQALQQTSMWSLPFLPSVVGRLALLPEATNLAVGALMANRSQVSEVVAALTEVTCRAKLACAVPAFNAAAAGNDGHTKLLKTLLTQLAAYAPQQSSRIIDHVKSMQLSDCDPSILRRFVEELLQWQASLVAWPRTPPQMQALESTISVWVKMLQARGDAPAADWDEVLQAMEREVLARGGAQGLEKLVAAVLQHVPTLATPKPADRASILATLQQFLLRVLGQLEEGQVDGIEEADRARTVERQEARQAQSTIVVMHFTVLVVQGCQVKDAEELFRRCPKGMSAQLAECVVKAAKDALWWTKANEVNAQVAAAEDTARLTLNWLARKEPRGYLGTLAKLWPRVLESDRDGTALEALWGLFGPAPNEQAIVLVEGLLQHAPQHLLQPALRWLGDHFPRHAARLWPRALAREVDPTASMAELLELCRTQGLEPPELPVARNVAAIGLLAASPLPAARLAAVRFLQELDLRGKQQAEAEVLKGLCDDADPVVNASARVVWSLSTGGAET